MKKELTQLFSWNRSLKTVLTLALISLLSSCAVTLPVSGNNTTGTKTGVAKATSVFGLWTDADASIKTAAKNAGITKISTVDVETTNYMYIVRIYKTIVTGD